MTFEESERLNEYIKTLDHNAGVNELQDRLIDLFTIMYARQDDAAFVEALPKLLDLYVRNEFRRI